MFYTTGYFVKQEAPELTPYAAKYGMWEGDWAKVLPVLDKDWKPFLEGKAGFKEALNRVVADL